MNHPSQSDLKKLFTNVCDITDNEFDVSNTIITINSSKKYIRPLFERFWYLLLQVREIIAWWVCITPTAAIEEIPYLCLQISKKIQK